jgi:hypothetical protein
VVWLLADKILDRPVYDKLRINVYKLRNEREEEIKKKTAPLFNVGVKNALSSGGREG